jgi:exosortase
MPDSSHTTVPWSVRIGGFLLFWVLSLAAFREPLAQLITLASQDERYSYILTIPFISGLLIWLDRKGVFSQPRFCAAWGMPWLLAGGMFFWLVQAQPSSLNPNDRLTLLVLALFLVWTAGFLVFYGPQVVSRVIFPVSFLILIVPLPPVVLDRIVVALQAGSADISFVLFKILRVPVFREGLKFALPGVDIEVAKQCSGIRSSMSLFIASILVGHALLRSGWRRIFLCVLTIPVVIFKNAVRIVTISWLGVYADQRFFFGKLHHAGGLPFSLVALAILGALLFVLRRTEARPPKSAASGPRWSPPNRPVAVTPKPAS